MRGNTKTITNGRKIPVSGKGRSRIASTSDEITVIACGKNRPSNRFVAVICPNGKTLTVGEIIDPVTISNFTGPVARDHLMKCVTPQKVRELIETRNNGSGDDSIPRTPRGGLVIKQIIT